MIVKNLPLESATVAAMRGGDEFREWDLQSYLIASVIDAVRENTYAFIAANSKRKPKPPEPVNRPVKAKPKKNRNMFSVMAGQRLEVARRAREAAKAKGA